MGEWVVTETQDVPGVAVDIHARRRRILAGFVAVLACLSILMTTVAVWTHQVAFNTERFTALVGRVTDDPAFIAPLSSKISTQVVDALDVQGRIAARLPDVAKPLAGTLALSIRDGIDKRLQVALANPKIQAALVQTLGFAHTQVMRLLRGQSDAVTVENGYIQVAVFPVVGAALTELQSAGLIPPGIQLPDFSEPVEPGVLAQRLGAALGVTLPEDFGTIQLMPADRLLAARSAVQAFDAIVVALVILSVILIALALWLARDRRRMLIYLAIGTIIAFLLARLAIRGIEGVLIQGIADGDVAGAVRVVLDATFADLRSLARVVLIATAIAAVVAYLWGRPKWVVTATSQARDMAGRAGSTAATAGSAGVAAAGAKRPSGETVERTVRERRVSIERAGVAIIAFVIVWLALGIDIAVLAAVLVIGFELVLRALAREPGADAAADRTEVGPTAGA
jgi:hypothetical protein